MDDQKTTSELTEQDLAELRAALLAKRRELIGLVQKLRAEMHGSCVSDDGKSDELECAAEQQGASVAAGLLSTEARELREIDQALRRMEEGNYGICQATGKPIGIERLRARPWARHSIEYARELERQRVQRGARRRAMVWP